jgi:LacI family transcriptional regulator
VDGLLIVAHDQAPLGLEAITRYRLPAVFALHNMPSSDHSFVGIDDEKAMYIATHHLLGKGRRKIALLKSTSTSTRGIQGYVRALEEYGLSCGEELRVPVELKARSGYDNCQRLIREKSDFDGMVLPHDILFPGIYKALAENNLSCPKDVSIVGYGNMDLCPFFPVPLTSIGLHLREIGMDALQVLMNAINLDRLGGEDISVQKIHRIIREPELIVRESS